MALKRSGAYVRWTFRKGVSPLSAYRAVPKTSRPLVRLEPTHFSSSPSTRGRWRWRFFRRRNATLRLEDSRIEFAAVHKNRSGKIQEHERDHHGGKSRVGRDVVAGEAFQILSEHGTCYQRCDHRDHDAGHDFAHLPCPGRQPFVQDD